MKTRKSRVGNIIWGLIFLAVAAALIMGGLGWFTWFSGVNMFWVVLLVIVLLVSLMNLFWCGVFFPLAFLAMIFDEPLLRQYTGQELPFWPMLGGALCLSIAFHIFFAGRRRRKYFLPGQDSYTGHVNKYSYSNPNYNANASPAGAAPVDGEPVVVDGGSAGGEPGGNADYANSETDFAYGTGGVDGSFVRAEASFNRTVKYINSEDLRRAEIECSFASMDVYFDNAKIPCGSAAIIVSVSFGALNLFLPKEWNVSVSVNGGFSGTQEENIPPPSVIKTANVMILGEVSFSGLTVTYI